MDPFGRKIAYLRVSVTDRCDLRCVYCMAEHMTFLPKADLLSLEELDRLCSAFVARGVRKLRITGGEPLMHNLDSLTTALQQKGFETNIETSGSSPLSGHWNWICLSPKKFKAPLPEVVKAAHELKVVVFNKHDFEWAEKYAAQVKPGCKLFLQPEWDKSGTITPMIIDYIKQHPQWELSLQIHKYINVP